MTQPSSTSLTAAPAVTSADRTQFVRVWDPLVRLFHLSLATAVLIAFLTEDDLLGLHLVAGYTVLVLIGVRLVWGLIGPRHARWSDFVRGPRATLAYLKDALKGRAARHLGHNPAGAAMVVALLLGLTTTALSGMAVLGASGAERAPGPIPARPVPPGGPQPGGVSLRGGQPHPAPGAPAPARRGLRELAAPGEPGAGHDRRPQAEGAAMRRNLSRIHTLPLVAAALIANLAGGPALASPQALIAAYQAAGAGPFDAAAGQRAWTAEQRPPGADSTRSCATCHGTDLTKPGRHATTGKVIEPLGVFGESATARGPGEDRTLVHPQLPLDPGPRVHTPGEGRLRAPHPVPLTPRKPEEAP